LLAASIALLRAMDAGWTRAGITAPTPAFHAGHSMGQYSALVAAGVLDLADAARLVRLRGTLMQAAPDGAMAAIIGLDDARLPDLEAAGSTAGTFTIANRNSPGQVVVSGERAAVEAAAAAAKELGAKRAIVLPVSVAAHSPLMADAAAGMRAAIDQVPFRDPSGPLLANADARPLITADACRDELVEHLTRGVDWVRAVRTMADAGVDTFIEVGPGKVLTGLVKRIAADATIVATDEPGAPGAIRLPLTD
jgi:[acyl-carrier-protein] S-malonyltransferase